MITTGRVKLIKVAVCLKGVEHFKAINKYIPQNRCSITADEIANVTGDADGTRNRIARYRS